MEEKNVADWLVQQLAAWGVKAVYGVPGDAVLPFLDALHRHGGIRFYSTKHEETAALMASAEAKLTGRLGVCTATSGPGLANLINGLADAKYDRAPVLAVTGQVAVFNLDTNYKQYVDQGMLLAPVADYSGLAVDPRSCRDITVKAMRTALARGTVTHAAFTRDVWMQKTAEQIRPFEPYLDTMPYSGNDVVLGALKILNEAERPAILAGRGARGSGEILLDLAEKWDGGICLTMAAKGLLYGGNPFVMGGLGEGGSEASTAMLSEADVILIAGATWWPPEYVPSGARIVQMDAVPENIGMETDVTYGVVGDLKALLPQLLEGIKVKEKWAWREKLHSLRGKWLKRIEREIEAKGSPVHPASLMKSLERAVKSDAVIALDVGDHAVWFNRIFAGSGQDVLISGSWRTMGFGLPAALSAKIAEPRRQVVALVGDGGLSQLLAEFSTAVRYRLPITVVVVNNGYLAMEKGRMEIKQMAFEETSLTNPDFARFAEICGGKGYSVKNAEDLDGILREALDQNLPALVDVMTAAPVFPETADSSDYSIFAP